MATVSCLHDPSCFQFQMLHCCSQKCRSCVPWHHALFTTALVSLRHNLSAGYQNQCLAECQGVAVLAAPGPCTAASNVGAKMVQAFAAAAASDSSLVAAMSAYRVPPLTAAQLDQVAAAAAGVVQGFDRSAGTRVVTAADMARLEGQGMVLVGVMKAVPGFRPAPPPVPGDAADRCACAGLAGALVSMQAVKECSKALAAQPPTACLTDSCETAWWLPHQHCSATWLRIVRPLYTRSC